VVFGQALAAEEGRQWDVRVTHVERVKNYAPHVLHVVVDLQCEAAAESTSRPSDDIPADASRTTANNSGGVTHETDLASAARAGVLRDLRAAAGLARVLGAAAMLGKVIAAGARRRASGVGTLVATGIAGAVTTAYGLGRLHASGERPPRADDARDLHGGGGRLGQWLPVKRHVAMTEEGEAMTAAEFQTRVVGAGEPAVLTGRPGWLGAAAEAPDVWSRSTLPERAGAREVSVHVSTSRRLDWVHKNFSFRTMPMRELAAAVFGPSEGERTQEGAEEEQQGREFYYLRAVGPNPRKDRADFAASFPELAADVVLPACLPAERTHSSVLRVGSPGVELWTHFDVMANALLQLVGSKRVLLFPPDQEPNLYVQVRARAKILVMS
jgi:hypothetical protein